MYQVTVQVEIAAAHQLRDYEGECARVHGHTWQIEVTVRGNDLDPQGMLIDFRKLKQLVNLVVAGYDHSLLNDVPPFDRVTPTAENLAKTIFEDIEARLEAPGVILEKVTVRESPRAWATFRRDGQ